MTPSSRGPWASRRPAIPASDGPPLVLSAMTLRYAGFTDRVLAAAAAGFRGIGLGAVDYLDARHGGFSEEAMADYVAKHGLVVHELEFLKDWWTEADVRGVRLEEDMLFYLADILGVDRINVGLLDHGAPPPMVVGGFRRLCARAADHDLRIVLEFMPYSALPTLGHARALIAESGAPNAGLMLDSWHWHRSGASLDELLELDAAEVYGVQICDAKPVADHDLRDEGRHGRLLPGEGAVDLAAFTGALRRIGVPGDLPVGVEVLSDDLDGQPPVEVGRRAALAARTVLSAAHAA